MAITVTASNPSTYGWIVNGNSADASGCEELKAAPSTTGQSLWVKSWLISTGSAITVTLGAGETGGAVTAVVAGPWHMTANSQLSWVYDSPVKLAADTALVVDTSGAGDVTVLVEGETH